MTQDLIPDDRPPRRPFLRLALAFVVALSIAFSVYLVMNMGAAGGVASLWFLFLFPALLCALVCYIGDRDAAWSSGAYLLIPVVFVGLVDLGAAFVLHEGVICLLMLSPIWLAGGWAGAFAVRSVRRRAAERRQIESTFVILPLVAAILEGQIPTPHEPVLLTRSVLVHATPAEIWPYAVANPSIGAGEGRWNITQNLIGVPRPRATVMRGSGVGAVRTAYWGDHINFEEDITRWAPGQVLGWKFKFSNSSLRDYTDKHMSPDGQFLKIDSGDYTITPVSPGVTRLTLNTRYIAMTHANAYARLWGEFLLGDVQDNILTIIQHRAEAAHGRAERG
jgi:hypothetical protein